MVGHSTLAPSGLTSVFQDVMFCIGYNSDDQIHAFSNPPLDFNFIDHSSNIGWKEFQSVKPLIKYPGIYMKKTDVFWLPQHRSMPTSLSSSRGGQRLGATFSLRLWCRHYCDGDGCIVTSIFGYYD